MPRGSTSAKINQWSDRLERFANSAETVVQFCLAEGVSQPSFYQWKKKLGIGNQIRVGKVKRANTLNRPGKDESAFKPIRLTATSDHQQNTTIRLADGVEIELGSNLQVVDVVVRSVVKQILSSGAARPGGTPC